VKIVFFFIIFIRLQFFT